MYSVESEVLYKVRDALAIYIGYGSIGAPALPTHA